MTIVERLTSEQIRSRSADRRWLCEHFVTALRNDEQGPRAVVNAIRVFAELNDSHDRPAELPYRTHCRGFNTNLQQYCQDRTMHRTRAKPSPDSVRETIQRP